MNPVIHYRIREQYVRRVVPLMMYYAWRLHRDSCPRIPMATILDRYVDLWRTTCHYDGVLAPADPAFDHPQWSRLRERICALHDSLARQQDSRVFEDACLSLLWPHLEPRIAADSRPLRREEHPYGIWTVTFREETVMSVHMTNIYRPQSMFDHFEACAADLLALIRDTVEMRPAITTLFCGSWLNNVPPFQRFFPPEWVANLNRPVFHNDTVGVWGQYICRTGALHKVNAARLMTTGHHPYPLIHSQCSIERAMTHLKNIQ